MSHIWMRNKLQTGRGSTDMSQCPCSDFHNCILSALKAVELEGLQIWDIQWFYTLWIHSFTVLSLKMSEYRKKNSGDV